MLTQQPQLLQQQQQQQQQSHLNPLSLSSSLLAIINEDKQELKTKNSYYKYTKLVELKTKYSLPAFLLAEIDSAESKIFMGLIRSAKDKIWAAVDYKLFIFDYDGNNFFCLEEDDSSAIITCVSNVFLSHQGIFVDSGDQVADATGPLQDNRIPLIAVASTRKVFLLSLMENDVYSTDISVSVPEDEVFICIHSFNGQVFLGSKSGNIYEMVYEREEGFFKRKCYLKNLTRNILSYFMPTFLVTSQGMNDCILKLSYDRTRNVFYSFKESGLLELYEVIYEKDRATLKYMCKVDLNNSVDSHKDERVVEIFVEEQEKKTKFDSVAVVAVSNRGRRLYFKFMHFQLTLINTRNLPSFEDSNSSQASSLLPFCIFDTCYYSNGLYFASGNAQSVNRNLCLVSSLDPAKYKSNTLGELVSVYFEDDGERVWDVLENEKYENFSNEVKYEVVKGARREIVVLSNKSVRVYKKLNLADFFVKQLQSIKDVSGTSFSEDIVCVLLSLLCDSSDVESLGNVGLKNQVLQLLSKFQSASLEPQVSAYGSAIQGDINWWKSYLVYVGRLIDGVVTCPIHELFHLKDTSAFGYVIVRLDKLEKHLVSVLSAVSSGSVGFQQQRQGLMAQAPQQQHQQAVQAVQGLLQLVKSIRDGCSFLSMVLNGTISMHGYNSNELSMIASSNGMKVQQQADFGNTTLTEVITSQMQMSLFDLVFTSNGKEMIKEIGRRFIDDIIKCGLNVDSVCSHLQQCCGEFFNSNDLKVYKAKQLLAECALATAGVDTKAKLSKSLDLFSEAAQALTLDQVENVCEAYQELGYLEGTAALCLKCSQLHSVQHRSAFYNYLLTIIDKYLTNSVESAKGQAESDIYPRLFKNSPLFQAVYKSKDESFMTVLFDYLLDIKKLIFMVKQNLVDEIPFLLQYLEQRQYKRSEFGLYLCLVYRCRKEFDHAVSKLHELATSDRFPAELDKRIELLTLCLNIGRSVANLEDVMLEVQDLLDVANVQWELMKQVQDASSKHQLNQRLFTITELYNLAESEGLDVLKLDIFFVSNFQNDPSLIVQTWGNLFDKYLAAPLQLHPILQELSIKYANTFVFPLNDVLFELEARIVISSDDVLSLPEHKWIIEALCDQTGGGFGIEGLVKAYESLIEEKTAPFDSFISALYIIKRRVFYLCEIVLKNQLIKGADFLLAKLLTFSNLIKDQQMMARTEADDILQELNDLENELKRLLRS